MSEASTQRERSHADYAIEHGEYLAKAADRLLEVLSECDTAASELNELDPDDEEYSEATWNLDRAMEAQSDNRSALKTAVYEFRKRAERAKQTAAEQAATIQVLCDRLDRIHQIATSKWGMTNMSFDKVRKISELSGGFAPIPPCSICKQPHAEPEQACPQLKTPKPPDWAKAAFPEDFSENASDDYAPVTELTEWPRNEREQP